MVDAATQIYPKNRSEQCTQTNAYTPSLTTEQMTETLSRYHLSVISARTLRATLCRELATRMKIPNSLNAEMKLVMDFPGISATAWRTVFPEGNSTWMTSPDGQTETGLILSMAELNSALKMEKYLEDKWGMGCTRLHLPATGYVARTLISFSPPWQIWSRKEEDGAISSIITCWMVLLDESGELRTPPNHTYTDAEETQIQATLRANLTEMMEKSAPLSPTFLRLLGKIALAQEVETALEERMETAAARKRKREARQQQQQQGVETEAVEEEAQTEEVEEVGEASRS